MLVSTLLLGRAMPKSFNPITCTLLMSLAMRTQPRRISLIIWGENVWVSESVRKRSWTGSEIGKPRSVGLMAAPKADAKPLAPKGRNEEKLEKKNLSMTESFPPLKIRSQLAVNWSSRNLPGKLKARGPVLTDPVAASKPGVPGTVGNR